MHHERNTDRDRNTPNRESNMEPAEGSRENVAGGSQVPPEAFGEQGGGISNRPLEEEEERQEQLPPRGERRENWKED